MALLTNKRQQARNERALQELLRSVPGNDVCADCQARNPGWASYSLGIFLCVRCASYHRSLGTHISKVKSISMDLWSLEQVETMKRIGNTTSNRLYNPRNVRPKIPLDSDMVDSAMERFIRQKYQHRSLSGDTLASQHNTGSTTSSDDRPPPPPPKPMPRFAPGLRAASSTFPISRREQPLPQIPTEPTISGTNALVGPGGREEKGVRDISIIGGGDSRTQGTTSPSGQTGQPPRAVTDGDHYWQSRASPPPNPHNPFNENSGSSPSQQSIEQAMQGLNISEQPVYPYNSGSWPQRNQRNPFISTQQQSYFSEQGNQSGIAPNRNPYFQPTQPQYPQPVNAVSQPQQFQTFSPPPLDQYRQPPPVSTLPNWNSLDQSTPHYAQHLFGSPSSTERPLDVHPTSQPQTPLQPFPGSVSHVPNAFEARPYFPQQFSGNSTFRYDKNSILALYSQPQFASAVSRTTPAGFEESSLSSQGDAMRALSLPRQQQRSATMPTSLTSAASASGPNLNPFANLTADAPVAPRSSSHTRAESREFAGAMMTNGRHSPDVFADLSARYA